MIQQQYYTREKRGIYSTTPGYDSIAKSKGLEDNFVKNILHPFCTYDVPTELNNKGEKDTEKFPKAFTCFNAENGELVIGQAVYVGADYTGMRNTFFAHNYVIPKDEKEEFVINPHKFFAIKSFKSSYEIEKGEVIPEVSLGDIAEKTESSIATITEVLKELGINEELYKKLIYALFMSVTNKRKVYVSFDVDTIELQKYSAKLMECLLLGLPYEIRRNIGFITYLREAKNKKFINISFVEKGNLRTDDTEVNRGYIFDFCKNKFLNINFDLASEQYLNFLWNSLDNPKKLRSFFDLFDEMFKNEDVQDKLSISTYSKAAYLYETYENEYMFFEENKVKIFEYAYEFLNKQKLLDRPWLQNVFGKIIEKEKKKVEDLDKYYTNRLTVKAFIDNYDKHDFFSRDINIIIFKSLLNAQNAKETNYIIDIFHELKNHKEMFVETIDKMYSSDMSKGNVLNWYIRDRMLKANIIEALFEEMNFWEEYSTKVIEDEFFHITIKDKIFEIIEKEERKVDAGKNIINFLNEFKDRCSSISKDYINRIINHIYKFVFKVVDISELTIEDIKELEEYYIKMINANNLEADEEKVQVIQELVKIVQYANNDINSKENFNIVSNLPFEYRNSVKQFMQKVFEKDVEFNQFDKFILGFVYYGSAVAKYNYDEIIQYILENFNNDKVMEFFIWYSDHMERSELKPFKATAKSYFQQTNMWELRNRKTRERLFSTKRGSIYKEIYMELSKGMKKVFIVITSGIRKKPLNFTIMLLLMIGVFLGTFYGIKYMNIRNQQEAAKLKEQKKVALLNKSKETANFSEDEKAQITKEIKDTINADGRLRDNEYSIYCEIMYRSNGEENRVLKIIINEDLSTKDDKTILSSGKLSSENSSFLLNTKVQVTPKNKNSITNEETEKVLIDILTIHVQEKEKKILDIK